MFEAIPEGWLFLCNPGKKYTSFNAVQRENVYSENELNLSAQEKVFHSAH